VIKVLHASFSTSASWKATSRSQQDCRPPAIKEKICDIDPAKITYYVGRETIIPSGRDRGHAVWRETLFAFLQHNAKGSATFFGVPRDKWWNFGTEIRFRGRMGSGE